MVALERGGVTVSGVSALPTYHRGVADHQFLFVNGRPVKYGFLVGSVRGAFADLVSRDRHPVVALFVELPPAEVDVNVHPAKTEVRFREPAMIRGMIVSGLKRALDEAGFRSVQRPSAEALGNWQQEPISSPTPIRSEEHTSELQSLMRISYAVFCLKKKKKTKHGRQH